MLRANELKVGNLVMVGGLLTRIPNGLFIDEHFDALQPVPLSRELLLRCGFDDDPWQRLRLPKRDDAQETIAINEGTVIIEQEIDGGADNEQIYDILDSCKPEERNKIAYFPRRNEVVWPVPVQYLHQFQNLYFAFTNEELEITF
jgi:hypothetical protein